MGKICTIKKEERYSFSKYVTELLPAPRYSIVYEGEEVFPLWVSRKEAVDWSLKQLNIERGKVKVQLATPEFQAYYCKIQKMQSNRRLGVKDDALNKMEIKRQTDNRYPYLSVRGVIACPHCGKLMDEPLDDASTEDMTRVIDIYGEKDGMLVLNFERMFYVTKACICKHCGKEISDIQNIDNFGNLRARGLTLFEDGDKIICSGFINSFYINPNAENIGMKAFRTRVVFNTRTGQTYMLPDMTVDGKKLKGTSSHLINCTYGGCGYTVSLHEQWKEVKFQEAIVKALLEKRGQQESIEEWLEALSQWNSDIQVTLENIMARITLMNRFPMFNPLTIENLENTMRARGLKHQMSKIFHRVATTSSIADFITAVDIKLPKTKTVKRLIAKDVTNAFKLEVFYSYGFRKIDLMERFCSIERGEITFATNGYPSSSKQKKNFVKALIAKRGDVVAMNLLCSSHNSYLSDTAMMYEKLLLHNVLSDDDFKGNLKEIHDNFSRLVNRIKFANAPIKYSEKEIKRYNMQINNLSFKLATDTHELIRVGQDMHICVGGYGDRALSRSCTIVVARDEKDIPKICIELDSRKKLRQAKTICNNLPQANLAVALKEWVEKTSIDDDSCCDYRHIKEGNIEFDESKCYTSRGDFHNLEVNENGDVVTAAEHRRAANNVNVNNANDNVFAEDFNAFIEDNGLEF